MGALGRRAGRIGQEDEGSGLGGLFGECVVEHQAEHAALSRSHVEGAHGYLVRLTFPDPFYMYEALGGQLFLCGTRIPSGEAAALRSSGTTAIAVIE